MAITAIYKATLLACLLVGAFAEDDPIEFRSDEPEILSNEPETETSRRTATRFVNTAPYAAVKEDEEAKLLQLQNSQAKYSFATSLVDGIMDNMQLRTESRDGLEVTGMYSYSDGFFQRTVKYIADENGYRVLAEEVTPLGDGPKIDINGRADVRNMISGQEVEYSITTDDIAHYRRPLVEA